MKFHLRTEQISKAFGRSHLRTSGIKINDKEEIKFVEKNKVKVLPYRIVQRQNQRNGFLKLDLEQIDQVDINKIRQHNDAAALQPLQYNMQKSLITEYEYDYYFDKKQKSILREQDDSNSDPDITQMDQQIKLKKESLNHQNAFSKIIQIQQMQIQYLMWRNEQQKQQEQQAIQDTLNIEQAIKIKENELKKSKYQLKQLKEEIDLKKQMIEEIQKKLLTKCCYRCKICPNNKFFESEEFLKNHHKRKHPGMLEMHCGDLNYKMMEYIQESTGLIQQRMGFSKKYFEQEHKRIEQEISTNIIYQIQQRSTEFKEEILKFHKNLLDNADKKRAVSEQFQEQNKLLEEQTQILYKEFIKIQEEIKQAEIDSIKAHEERERERKRREKEERERIERERREEEERLRKLKEEEDQRLLEMEALKKKRDAEKKKRNKGRQGSFLDSYEGNDLDSDELHRRRILQEQQREEELRKKREEEELKERRRRIKNNISKLKENSKAYFKNFNRLVNNRKKGKQNYEDAEYNQILSTQLFDKYNAVFDKFKLPFKMNEISIRTSQIAQLEDIYQKITGEQSIASGSSSQFEEIGQAKKSMLQEEMLKKRKEQQLKIEEEQEAEMEDDVIHEQQEDDQDNIFKNQSAVSDQGKNFSLFSKKSKKETVNPLFDTKKRFKPYFSQPQLNPKLRDLEFRKEKDIKNALQVADSADIYFAIGVSTIQKSRIVGDKLEPEKQLKKNVLVSDQNPLKIENVF